MANGINIPAGAFTGAYGFPSFFFPTLAQGIAGYMRGQREREIVEYERGQSEEQRRQVKQQQDRQYAIQRMQLLLSLHGRKVVEQPEFSDLYQSIVGRPWPTITEETDEIVTPERTIQQPIDTGGLAIGEGLTQPVTQPAVTRRVTKTRPSPLGGADREITLGQLGLIAPDHPLARQLAGIPVSMAKELGIKFEDIYPQAKTTKKTKEDLIVETLMKIRDKTATPQDMAILEYLVDKKTVPNTMEEAYVRALIDANYNTEKVPPVLRKWAEDAMASKQKQSVIEQIRAQVAKSGFQSLTPGQQQLYVDEIGRRPEKYTFEDYKLDLISGRAAWPTDSRALALVTGRAGRDIPLDQARFELAKAEAELSRIKAIVQGFYARAREKGKAPGEMAGTAALDFADALKDLDKAAGNTKFWAGYVQKMEAERGAPEGMPTPPPASGVSPSPVPPGMPMVMARQAYESFMTKFMQERKRRPSKQEFLDAVQRRIWPPELTGVRDALLRLIEASYK